MKTIPLFIVKAIITIIGFIFVTLIGATISCAIKW